MTKLNGVVSLAHRPENSIGTYITRRLRNQGRFGRKMEGGFINKWATRM